MTSRSSSPCSPRSFNDSPSAPFKRKRQASESEPTPPEIVFPCTYSDGRMKPRRIDPDRLAVRLGPELTAEMDAYIVPGAKMPTFDIRQYLVKKYNVDRRHIYDYFHSRGLRVAKEDKHSNLSHRMSRKGKMGASSANRKAQPKGPKFNRENIAPESEDINSVSAVKSPAPLASSLSTKPKRPAKRQKTVPKPLPKPRKSAPAPVARSLSPFAADDVSPVLSAVSFSDDFSLPDEPEFTLDSTLVQEPTSFLDEMDLRYHADSTLCEPSLMLDAPSEFLAEMDALEERTLSFEMDSFTFCDPLASSDGLSLLTEGERTQFYELVDACIGPPIGIEESSGTCKSDVDQSYMHRVTPVPTTSFSTLIQPSNVLSSENTPVNPHTMSYLGPVTIPPSTYQVRDSHYREFNHAQPMALPVEAFTVPPRNPMLASPLVWTPLIAPQTWQHEIW